MGNLILKVEYIYDLFAHYIKSWKKIINSELGVPSRYFKVLTWFGGWKR